MESEKKGKETKPTQVKIWGKRMKLFQRSWGLLLLMQWFLLQYSPIAFHRRVFFAVSKKKWNANWGCHFVSNASYFSDLPFSLRPLIKNRPPRSVWSMRLLPVTGYRDKSHKCRSGAKKTLCMAICFIPFSQKNGGAQFLEVVKAFISFGKKGRVDWAGERGRKRGGVRLTCHANQDILNTAKIRAFLFVRSGKNTRLHVMSAHQTEGSTRS